MHVCSHLRVVLNGGKITMVCKDYARKMRISVCFQGKFPDLYHRVLMYKHHENVDAIDASPVHRQDSSSHHCAYRCASLCSWWCHQLKTFFALLALCVGNSPVTSEFPTQRPVTRSFDVFYDLRLNKRLSKQSWGWWFETLSSPLWHHCNVVLEHQQALYYNGNIFSRHLWLFYSLWSGGAIWWIRTGSTLTQIMVCCLMAPSHYLNQCWLIISEGNWTRDTSAISY